MSNRFLFYRPSKDRGVKFPFFVRGGRSLSLSPWDSPGTRKKRESWGNGGREIGGKEIFDAWEIWEGGKQKEYRNLRNKKCLLDFLKNLWKIEREKRKMGDSTLSIEHLKDKKTFDVLLQISEINWKMKKFQWIWRKRNIWRLRTFGKKSSRRREKKFEGKVIAFVSGWGCTNQRGNLLRVFLLGREQGNELRHYLPVLSNLCIWEEAAAAL